MFIDHIQKKWNYVHLQKKKTPKKRYVNNHIYSFSSGSMKHLTITWEQRMILHNI